ncbi:MAG: DUF2202 domain-containing protein [Thiobacillus sp.]|nr:DUF2202 domain-containing protein [Thiobacillus sp.]
MKPVMGSVRGLGVIAWNAPNTLNGLNALSAQNVMVEGVEALWCSQVVQFLLFQGAKNVQEISHCSHACFGRGHQRAGSCRQRLERCQNHTIESLPGGKTDLLFMREEEKLARDVYLTLYETWGLAVFSNIASSEQSHMDALLKLLRTYRCPTRRPGTRSANLPTRPCSRSMTR